MGGEDNDENDFFAASFSFSYTYMRYSFTE